MLQHTLTTLVFVALMVTVGWGQSFTGRIVESPGHFENFGDRWIFLTWVREDSLRIDLEENDTLVSSYYYSPADKGQMTRVDAGSAIAYPWGNFHDYFAGPPSFASELRGLKRTGLTTVIDGHTVEEWKAWVDELENFRFWLYRPNEKNLVSAFYAQKNVQMGRGFSLFSEDYSRFKAMGMIPLRVERYIGDNQYQTSVVSLIPGGISDTLLQLPEGLELYIWPVAGD